MAQRIKINPAFNAFMLISLVLLIGIASVLPSNSYALPRTRAEVLDEINAYCAQLTADCGSECHVDEIGQLLCADDAPCFTVCRYYDVICLDPNDLCCATTVPFCGSDDPCSGDPNCDNSCGNNSGSGINWNLGTAGNP